MFDLSVNQTDYKNFYPTPDSLVTKMMYKVKNWDAIKTALEPEAGKGDIARAVRERRGTWRENKVDVDCIEIDQNLQYVLKGEGFKVVHDDFLSFNGFKRYDLIIMNPPFDCGDKHLLKALDMQKKGGEIVCLLNAETLLNPYSNVRKDLIRKLNDLNADIEFLKDSFCYDAERETDVKVALVYVNIAEDRIIKEDSFIVNDLRRAKEQTYSYREAKEITSKLDLIEQLVEQFEFEVKGTLRLIEEYQAFKPYMKCGFTKKDENGKPKDYYAEQAILQLTLGKEEVTVNQYMKKVRSKYWSALFTNEEFTKNLTSNLVNEYREHIEKMADYDFSVFNIKSIQLEMAKNMVKGVEETILSFFDELSHKHYWDNDSSANIHYYNGWKTNKSYYINKKVIIPLQGWYDMQYSWGRYNPTDYHVVAKLTDMEKVFNYLDGGLTEDVDIKAQLSDAEQMQQTKKIKLKYFDVTFYKKGTCHIEFTNLDLLKKFNIFGGRGKSWLPPAYGKKTYEQMSEEEKSVIDEFEGKEEYSKVVANQNYYIMEGNQLLELPEAV